MSDVDTHRRAVAVLMTLEAASLVVVSSVHLSRSKPDAGIGEAVVCAVLASGAVAVYRALPSWRSAAMGAVGFAMAGFLLGLSVTARGDNMGDLAYHGIVLPLLVCTLALAMPASTRGLTARSRR
jgi:hypothetical protein